MPDATESLQQLFQEEGGAESLARAVIEAEAAPLEHDPRGSLADWANRSDEWVRRIVREVLSTGGPLPEAAVGECYQLFREEKALEPRKLAAEPKLQLERAAAEAEMPMAISRISDVHGVNALVTGAVIEPHEGLTILFGENGTGKTGYSRILKALAGSRTADEILGNVNAAAQEQQTAKIEYTLGSDAKTFTWNGENRVAPFTRMAIFDSPAVNFHVDDELDYVYVPSVLALFNHVNSGLKGVQELADTAIKTLNAQNGSFLARFPKGSSVYPLIEALGASTDLADLKSRANGSGEAPAQLDLLRRTVAALESDSAAVRLQVVSRYARVLTQASSIVAALSALDPNEHNARLKERYRLQQDYAAFRNELFRQANLPAEPDPTWEAFIQAGNEYREHLEASGKHDSGTCIYCRQGLTTDAQRLVARYAEYLEDRIKQQITAVDEQGARAEQAVRSLNLGEMDAFLAEYEGRDDKPTFYLALGQLRVAVDRTLQIYSDSAELPQELPEEARKLQLTLTNALNSIRTESASLREQVENGKALLAEKRQEARELEAAIELARSWAEIEQRVGNLKEADRLKSLGRAFSQLIRNVTDLAKIASDELINQNFDKYFREECAALRAPDLKLEFVGRQGRAQRRKVLSDKKPSKVLSEGEQKFLAIADFLAEARLTGITAPVIFDDPVSSLDYRRINEVSKRIAMLVEDNQVIVFTHDIFFATTLLALFEKSKRCIYYQIDDNNGKGNVSHASGPRWDTLANIKKEINLTIEAAKKSHGESQAALIRTGYNWIRSWCEVFVEKDLLRGVTERYQPNVRMTVLPEIKTAALPAAIAVVQPIFEEACRYIDGHSQPLASLAVGPSLAGLEEHWQKLQDAKKAFDSA
jgi:recombinational DNA repair ATPase RecF